MLLITYRCFQKLNWRPLRHSRYFNNYTYKNYSNLSSVPKNNPEGIGQIAKRRFSRQKSDGESGKQQEWRGIVTRFLPIGLCLVAVMQWRAYRKYSGERVASQLEVDAYTILPLKAFSRCWGMLADLNQPEFMRPYIYGMYINLFGVNLTEAANEDLKSYQSLSEFFVRTLKDGVRTIDKQSELVSPCDGRVLHVTAVNCGKVEQVKGITYPIEQFLGENIWNPPTQNEKIKYDYEKSLLINKNNDHCLYQCVIYLAPGDYHRFHSPADWRPFYRRHFPGQLLSVNPSIARWIPGLFCLNERAVYVGEWKHGFFSYTPVGATNVGSMRVYFDRALTTNSKKVKDVNQKFLGDKVDVKKGDMIGEFRMGSTIVLLFEAPKSFKFSVSAGQKVRLGQALGNSKGVQSSLHTET